MSQIINYPQGKIGPENERSGRIMAAGIILLICGIMSSCILLTLPLALLAPRQPGRPQIQSSQLIAAGLIYASIGAMFITLSIGAFGKRRWFRPLTLILCVHWLIMGAFGFVSYLFMIPMMSEVFAVQAQATNSPLPANFGAIILVFSLLFILAIGVALPLTILLLLKSIHAKETLEYFSPKPCWTDHCPIKILGMAITLIIAGAIILMAIGNAWIPFGPTILKGPLAIVLIVATSGLLITAGLLVFKLDIRGWWIGLITITLFSLLAVPTPFFVSPVEYYRMLGQPPEMIEVAQNHESLLRILTCLFPLALAISFPIYMWRLKPQLEAAAKEKKLATDGAQI